MSFSANAKRLDRCTQGDFEAGQRRAGVSSSDQRFASKECHNICSLANSRTSGFDNHIGL